MNLTKHHGLGNDFLVAVDATDESPLTADQAVALCDRTRGVGADGVLHVTRSSTADLAMVLLNADGSRAEMSGNGISCVGQAAVLAGLVETTTFTIDSDVGIKTLTLCDQASPTRHTFRVDLGEVSIGAEATEWIGGAASQGCWVDVGNPHLVLLVAAHESVDLVELGTRANTSVPGGTNVETVVVRERPDEITMRVYERGVGLTDACGTGACASAAAAHAWGLVGERVTVQQPGGVATVELGSVTHYTVEVEAVARVEWPWQ